MDGFAPSLSSLPLIDALTFFKLFIICLIRCFSPDFCENDLRDGTGLMYEKFNLKAE